MTARRSTQASLRGLAVALRLACAAAANAAAFGRVFVVEDRNRALLMLTGEAR